MRHVLQFSILLVVVGAAYEVPGRGSLPRRTSKSPAIGELSRPTVRFERRGYESRTRLSGTTLGWPNGVPRIANLDEEPRRKSAKSRPSPPKPLAMPRLIRLTAAEPNCPPLSGGKRHPIHILEAGSACLNVRGTRLEFQSDKSPMLGRSLGKTGFGMR